MNMNSTHTPSIQEQKQKVRERYRGIDRSRIEIIPCIEPVSFYEDTSYKRVAVYARVSTDSVKQTTSFELQKNYYESEISRHPGWELTEIYADEGISGTSLNHRDSFMRMIADCEAGKIDLIVTKSVSRFARNVVDCIGEVRRLAALPTPVGVFFESESIYTLNQDSEMSLSFVSAMAQEESHTKSRIMNTSYEMRFAQGILITPPLLGYDLDEDGNLIINEEEALTVRLCFFMYLYGYSTQQIADTLMKLGRITKKGNKVWSTNTVLNVLQNERHCGDVLAHKTWTPNYLDHKSRKNRMDRKQYLHKGHHESIVSREDFITVQRLIANAKYGYKGLLPYLHVINSGALQGFVEINPKWGGFTAEDYMEAAHSIETNEDDGIVTYQDKEVHAGEFDLRGYEIARVQFFQTWGDMNVTFSHSDVLFSKPCIRKLNNQTNIELLFDPIHHLFAVRPTTNENRHGVVWAKVYPHSCTVKAIAGSAFMPTVYEILGWKAENKYRIRGVRRQKGDETVLLFDMHDTEVYIPLSQSQSKPSRAGRKEAFELFDKDTKPVPSRKRNSMVAYPKEWAASFGREVYCHEQAPEVAAIDRDGQWDIAQSGVPYMTGKEVIATSPIELEQGISSILTTIKKEAEPNG